LLITSRHSMKNTDYTQKTRKQRQQGDAAGKPLPPSGNGG